MRTCTFSDEQLEKIHIWQTMHDKTCPMKYNSGAIGGRFTYSFTPTGVGVIKLVICACGEKYDVSAYEEW